MNRVGLAEAIEVATAGSPGGSPGMTWSRCSTARVRMFGAMAGVAYQVDPAESQRRRAGGHGAVTELGIIDALLGLPTGIPVPWTAVSDRDRRRLRRAPSGAVESRGDQLVRQATVPLTVRFALVAARQWRDGLVKAGRFAPYCCRAMLLSRVPGDLDEAKVQAAFYGIGIYLVSRGELTTVVVPEPFTESRHSPAQWWFAEEVYRQVSDSSTSGG